MELEINSVAYQLYRYIQLSRDIKIQVTDHRKIGMWKDHHLKQGIYFLQVLLALAADISINRCVERMW